ncbi:unnamed protein product [Sphenostylis stenocarpa]|uniref:Uncharacterized protein n=1 Tax=Sphenostylis stenocarpa TaxID=92480 RepID=A0AA86SGA5_9FABA|nr:unnamed protein product [Sphenostylis stenocarpa]
MAKGKLPGGPKTQNLAETVETVVPRARRPSQTTIFKWDARPKFETPVSVQKFDWDGRPKSQTAVPTSPDAHP